MVTDHIIRMREIGTFKVVDDRVCIFIYLLTLSPRQLLHQVYPSSTHVPGPSTQQPKEKKLAKDPPSELKKYCKVVE